MFILTADEAKKHVEPPRLERLELRPSQVQLAPNGSTVFQVSGYDQHGQPFPVESASWTASAGAIDQGGRYVAPDAPGGYRITACVGSVAATAQVQVADRAVAPGPTPLPTPPSGTSEIGLRWEGTVPYQKWMNFYTKVVSKYVTLPGLKLKVEFEVPPSTTVTEAKLEETKTALRELGLNEEIQTTG